MEYIQCTHCGKRYAVSDRVKKAEGQFTTCKSCQEKFLIVIHDESDEPLTDSSETISTGGWDPSLTMPGQDDDDSESGQPSEEQSLDEDDGGAEVLEELKNKRQKQLRLYVLIGLLVCLIGVGVFFIMSGDESAKQAMVQTSNQTQAQLEQSPKVQDENSTECKLAAAAQWLIDYKAMHGDYSGNEFVRLLKLNESQSAKVREHCKNPSILQDIIDAATAEEKPSWIETEIKALQANQRH